MRPCKVTPQPSLFNFLSAFLWFSIGSCENRSTTTVKAWKKEKGLKVKEPGSMAENADGDISTTTHLLPSEGGRGENQKMNKRPREPWRGEYVKSIVYAGLDAIVSCFSLISSISAGRLSSVDVLVVGFANLVADGISMGFGDFVSTGTEKDVAAMEKVVTEWEVVNQVGPQQTQLIRRYQELGMDLHDATTVVNIFSKYKDILVDQKMTVQKGIIPPHESEDPWKSGLVTFASFLIFGSAPLLSFIVLVPFTNSDKVKFVGASVLSAFALVLLGMARAKIAGQNYAFSVVVTLFNGAIAAAAAYAIGWTLRNVAGLEN